MLDASLVPLALALAFLLCVPLLPRCPHPLTATQHRCPLLVLSLLVPWSLPPPLRLSCLVRLATSLRHARHQPVPKAHPLSPV
jgi:hypothetical protein